MEFNQESNNEFIKSILYGLAFVIVLLTIFYMDHKDTQDKQATIQACLNHGGTPTECAKLGR